MKSSMLITRLARYRLNGTYRSTPSLSVRNLYYSTTKQQASFQLQSKQIPKLSSEADVFYDDLKGTLVGYRSHGRLRQFSWTQSYDADNKNDGEEELTFATIPPKEFWDALFRIESLERLSLSFIEGEETTWHAAMESAHLPKLTSLSVDLSHAHGWEAGPLKTFISNHASTLTDLSVYLLLCCGPFGFDLHSIKFPALRTFAFAGASLSVEGSEERPEYLPEEFFQKHPTIEQLHLDVYETPLNLLEEKDLPALSRVRVESRPLSFNEAYNSFLRAKDTGKYIIFHIEILESKD